MDFTVRVKDDDEGDSKGKKKKKNWQGRDHKGCLFNQSNLRNKSALIKLNHLLMNQITWINVDITCDV